MKVYGFVGPSGTGKSYRALTLAKERGIPSIIDDGLFIVGNKVLAGTSAKREPTKIAAIRRALFMEEAHAASVREALRAAAPDALLILGTSQSMIGRIAKRLALPPVSETIRIEDISTDREIRLALRHRKEQGKHVIPVPTFEISKDFSGYFIDPLKIFRIRGREKRLETLEKTVVRPTYSYMGRFYIADSAIEAIAAHNAQKTEGVHRVLQVSVVSRPDGIAVYVDLAVCFGHPIHLLLEAVQVQVMEEITRVTGLNVHAVHAAARRLILHGHADTDPV